MTSPRLLSATLLVLGTAACTRSEADTSTPNPPGCPTWRSPIERGQVQADGLEETSGLAMSRQHANVLWAHNDSGNDPILYALGTDGAVRGVFEIDGVDNRDWEDLSAGVDADGAPVLLIADIGDNNAVREHVSLQTIPEPTTLIGTEASPIRVRPTTRELTYPDGAHNAEALVALPDGSVVVITKEQEGSAGVYLAAPDATSFERIDEIAMGEGALDGDRLVTGADLSHDGTSLIVRTYLNVWLWRGLEGDDLPTLLDRHACRAPAPPEPQGEAITLSSDGVGFWTISEGLHPTVFHVPEAP